MWHVNDQFNFIHRRYCQLDTTYSRGCFLSAIHRRLTGLPRSRSLTGAIATLQATVQVWHQINQFRTSGIRHLANIPLGTLLPSHRTLFCKVGTPNVIAFMITMSDEV
jgi:hypothetical protein